MLGDLFEQRPQTLAYNILMSSFYGVLATDKCRRFAARVAVAINAFGYHLLRWIRNLLA